MVFKHELVVQAFLGNLAKHGISFAHAIALLQLLLLLLEHNGLVEVILIVLRVNHLLHLLVGLVPLISLRLALDHGTPLVQVALRVPRVVPLPFIRQSLKLLTLVFQWLFDALGVNFQRIDQVVSHVVFICF